MTNPTASETTGPKLADLVPHEVKPLSRVATSLPRILNHLSAPANENDFVAIAEDRVASGKGSPAQAVIISAGYFAKLLTSASLRPAQDEETTQRLVESDALFAKHRAEGTVPAETDMDELFAPKG